MSTPFFSIIIPTKDRPRFVKQAIHSVLNQTFGDFELILTDNSDGNETSLLCQEFKRDSRFKYHRTGGLCMTDNWEYALRQTAGHYISYLTDRSVYRPATLEILNDVAKRHKTEILFWRYDCFDYFTTSTPTTKEFRRSSCSGLLIDVPKERIFQRLFTGHDFGWGPYFPTTLSTCFNNNSLRQISAFSPNRCCFPVSPDYTLAFLLLAVNERFLFLDIPLYVPTGYGNGVRCTRNRQDALAYLADTQISPEDFSKYMPITSPLIYNSIMRDFLAMKELCRPRLDAFNIDLKAYYRECLHDILVLRQFGSDWKGDRDAVFHALEKEPADVQNYVKTTRFYRWLRYPDMAYKLAPAYTMIRRLLHLHREPKRPASQLELPCTNALDAIQMEESMPRQFQDEWQGPEKVIESLKSHPKWPWKSDAYGCPS